jgi:DNA replication protein DnaC
MEKMYGQLGKRLSACTLENFERVAETLQAYQAAVDYVDKFEDYRKQGRGLWMQGGCGCGKSHLMAAIAKELTAKGYAVAFVSVPSFLDSIRRSFGSGSDIMDSILCADLIILDDIGVEKPTDWVLEQFYLLINFRYNNMLPICCTTNIQPGELSKRIGVRCVSRIVEMCTVLNVVGADYRLRGCRR